MTGNHKQETTEGENLASNIFSDYNIDGTYGYKKIIENFDKKYLVASVYDNDTSIDMTGIYFGFTGNGENALNGFSWIVSNSELTNKITYTEKYKYFSFFPKNEYTFKKIFTRYKIQIELSDSAIPTPYEKYTGGMESPSVKYPSKIEIIDGCNRFDKNDVTANAMLEVDTGEVVEASSTLCVSNFIPVEADKPVYLSDRGTSRTMLYDKNKKFLNKPSEEGGKTVITPIQDGYIRMTINLSSVNIDEVQLTEGTEEKPYLPHGSIGLKFSGKNFLKLQDGTYTNNGITCVVSDGVITANGTASINTVCNIPINEITLNGTCILSSFNTIENANVQARLDGDSETYYNLENVNATHTFTKNENIKYTKYVFRTTGGTTLNNFIVKPMLSVDVGDYEPYHEPQLIQIDLAGNSIDKISDTIKDELEIYRNGKITLKKKVNRYSFSGNEKIEKNTNYSTDSMLVVQFNKSDMKVGTTNILCNYFKYSSNTIINSIRAAGDYILFGLDKATFTDVDSFKSYLLQQYENETAVYVDYELATPQTIELPSVDMPQLWEGTVNVELISNLSSNLEVNYNILPAMPSIYSKSDVESAGEKYNIFNKDARMITSGTTKENLDTGVRVIGTIDGQYRYCSIELGKKELLGKNITMQVKMQSSNQNVGLASINFGNENSPAIKSINSFNKEYEKKVVSIPTEFPENCDRIYLILYANLNGTLKKGDYVDYKDLMVSIGSNEKPYVPYDIGAINIKQQNGNLLNTFDYTYVSGEKNITFKNGQFIFNGTWEKWLAQLYTWSLTNYWAETNYGNYMDLSKKSVNILKTGKYYLKIKYISGNISTNGGLKFTYRLNTNTTGKSLNIGEFKSNVKKGDIIKKTIEITEDTPFTLMTTMIRTEDTVYDNFTFEVMLEKDEETENFEEHKEVNHQMFLNKPLRGLKTDKSIANYIDENGNYWACDYISDDGIHRRIKKFILDDNININAYADKNTDNHYCYYIQAPNDVIVAQDKKGLLISNYFKEITWNNIYAKRTDEAGIALRDNKRFYIRVKEDTTEKVKKCLLERNVEVYYILNEETIEEFTEEERKSWNEFKKMKTFKSKNYMSSVDDIQAGLEFSYKKDNRISTKKELEKCNERLANIEQLLSTTETSSLLLDNLENDLKKEVE